jgi:hypothetical protein
MFSPLPPRDIRHCRRADDFAFMPPAWLFRFSPMPPPLLCRRCRYYAIICFHFHAIFASAADIFASAIDY